MHHRKTYVKHCNWELIVDGISSEAKYIAKNSLLNIKILLEKTDPFHMPIVEILLKTQ